MPYSKIDPDDMILRDHLAFDRTVLANERTLLAYLRTAIALLASGATLWKIFPQEQAMRVLGAILLTLGGLAVVAGIWRFVSVSRTLSATYEKPAG
jgi:putative membrane protein